MTDNFREILFDVAIGKNSSGEARWSTDCLQEETPNEVRSLNWSHPIWEWNLQTAIRSREDWEYVFHFHLGIAQGRAYGFRFRDSVFNRSIDSMQTSIPLLGIGDGVKTAFQLKRVFGSGIYAYAMPVNKPVADTVKIYIDETEIPAGHATYGWSVNIATGLVTFTSAANLNAKSIYTDFQFDFPVRFDADSIGSSWVNYRMHRYDVPLISLKPVDYTL